jgi:hypothetical protein
MLDENESRLKLLLDRTITGRPVSVVGNAASLLTGNHGKLIDSGCVLRMNAGVPVSRNAQGNDIDIHCFSARPNFDTNMQRARRHWLLSPRRDYFDQALSVWMCPELRDLCQDAHQLFYPLTMWRRLADELGAAPSVGAMALHMLSCLTQAETRIFGFDFKDSPTFYRKRENRGPHDWAAERRFVLSLAGQRAWTVYS